MGFELYPNAVVIIHLDRGHRQSLYDHNLDTVLKYGGKFDMVGIPGMNQMLELIFGR